MTTFKRGVASLLFFGAVTAVAGAGCSDDKGEPLPEGTLDALGSTPRVNSGIKTKMRFTIRNDEAWSELWSKVHQNSSEKPPVPDLDFDEQVIIVATMGETPDNAHETRIESVTVQGGGASVLVKELKPAQGCIVQPATATPLDMYVAPYFAAEPTYVEQDQNIICN